MSQGFNTCRFCKNEKPSKYGLVKYGVRHYAHADCGLENKGIGGFLDRLSNWQLEQFPFMALKEWPGYLDYVQNRLKKETAS